MKYFYMEKINLINKHNKNKINQNQSCTSTPKAEVNKIINY